MYNFFKELQRSLGRYKTLGRHIDFLWRITEGSPIVYRCRDFTPSVLIRVVAMIISIPFCLIRYFFPPKIDILGRKGLALVLIAKNEAPYIEEWVNFHHKQGVSHFIIYDNESEDDLRGVLTPYIESGLVTYCLIKGKSRQKDAYNMAIHDYGRKFRYMGFIDADEFVFVRNNTYGGGGGV